MGPAIIGIEVTDPKNFDSLIERMEEKGFAYQYLNDNNDLFEFLV
jgi:threonine dehydratase